jgi:cell division inhibitor SepF
MVAVNTDGTSRILAQEESSTFVYYNDLYRHWMNDGRHILWISERDDWRHLYMIDTEDGSIRQLTKGPWNVREIQRIDEEQGYELEGSAVKKPAYSYTPREDNTNDLKVVNHPNYKGYEVMVMEPRSFDDAAQIVQYLKERKTIVLNLHLLDKEQSQRTIDFVCGAAHALNGKPQKVGDLVFVFTPSNVTLSVDMNEVQNKFSDSLWRAPSFQ